MKLSDRFKLAINSFSNPRPFPAFGRDFLKYGNRRKPMIQNWSQILMTEQDTYTGYMYGALDRRANAAAVIGESYLKTKTIDKSANQTDDVMHPYLELIDNSDSFTNYQFWYTIATYLDFKGVAYLLVMRNFNEEQYGAIQDFRILNPFNIKRVVNAETDEIGGYVEFKGGMTRELPIQMVLPIKKLNPIDWNKDFSMVDAAKDSQFTMKSAADYARHAIAKNVNAPGIISTSDEDLALDNERFANFKARVLGHESGEPLFAAGKGALTWDDMQIDLNKVAMDKVAEVNINSLIAVTGVSKTKFGIEQSGVTRDTAKVQKDLFTEDHAIPLVQSIVDALNQDYKKHYRSEYETNKFKMFIDNPVGVNYETQIKHLEANRLEFELYRQLRDKGYDHEQAANFVTGSIDVDQLQEPETPDEPETPQKTTPPQEDEQNHVHADSVNILDDSSRNLAIAQQSSLQNAIVNAEQSLVGSVIDKITTTKNQYEDESDVISPSDKRAALNEIEIALAAFYGIMLTLFGSMNMKNRAKQYALLGNYKVNNDIKTYIRQIAKKGAESHVTTVLNDMIKVVQQKALEGASQQQIISALRQEFSEVTSKQRATTIARTETNRAFTQSQYQSDLQFLRQNKLETRAFKKWVVNNSNPCQYCQDLAARPPIPFKTNFANLGDELSYTYEKEDGTTVLRKLSVNYEPLEAGNAHPNCGCTYELIINKAVA